MRTKPADHTRHTAQQYRSSSTVPASKKRRALRFVLLIGVLSFFADFTYEGARGVTGRRQQTIISALFAPLVFLGDSSVALVGIALWGLGMGVHESIIPAAVGLMVPANRRASAYGLFTAGYGVFWFLGSVVIGVLYSVSLPALVAFSLVAELAALPLFFLVRRNLPARTTAR